MHDNHAQLGTQLIDCSSFQEALENNRDEMFRNFTECKVQPTFELVIEKEESSEGKSPD